MDYEPFKVDYTAGQPYVGATLSMYPAPGGTGMGNQIAWNAGTARCAKQGGEVLGWSGLLKTAGGLSCYGTLEGYLKCVDAKDISKELFKFKTPSGIIGNVFTYEYSGKQYIGVFPASAVGRNRNGGGLLEKDTDGLGAVGGYRELKSTPNLAVR